MKRVLCRLLLLAVWGVLCSACSVTRNIPKGSYLLSKVTIEADQETPRKERISQDELANYVQKPAKKFLGTNLPIWIYQHSDSTKHNGWTRWKREKVGKAPVLLDMNQVRRSSDYLKILVDSKGFLRSSAAFEVDTTSRPRRAKVTYRVKQRERYMIRKLDYRFEDPSLEGVILKDTLGSIVGPNKPFSITLLDAERERIAKNLNNQGYYTFNVNNITYEADTLRSDYTVDVTMVIHPYVEVGRNGEQIEQENLRYRINHINVYTDYNAATALAEAYSRRDTLYNGLNLISHEALQLRPSVLRQAISLHVDTIYSRELLQRTYSDLMALGFFRSTRINFTDLKQHIVSTDSIPIYNENGTLETHYVERHKEGLLGCDIYCTPTLRQSFKLELEGSTTASFYGLKTTVGYQNRNIFHGAESFDVSFSAGYEFMKATDAQMRRATEMGVTTGLTFPRFLLLPSERYYQAIVQPKTKIEMSVNFQDRPYYRRTLFGAEFGYQWSNRRYATFALQPVNINLIKVDRLDPEFLSQTENKYLANSYKTQLIAGLNFSYGYNNQRENLGGNATVVRFNFETSGNLLDGLNRIFAGESSRGYHRLFGIRYSQYYRTDLSVSRKLVLGAEGKVAVAGRLYGGIAKAYGNSDAVPFDRLFYAGGSNSMRGWAPRTLGPGTTPEPKTNFPTQLGDMKLEANLELRFPIWGVIHGASFFDLGNIWYTESNPEEYSEDAVFHFDSFYKQLGFNTGLGLRFDIKFAVLRLDWGVQLHNPNWPKGDRWFRKFRWANTAINFGVGYPF